MSFMKTILTSLLAALTINTTAQTNSPQFISNTGLPTVSNDFRCTLFFIETTNIWTGYTRADGGSVRSTNSLITASRISAWRLGSGRARND